MKISKELIIALGGCIIAISLVACGKYGTAGMASRIIGNWAQVNLPSNCVAKQVAAESESGVVVLCEDGRVFH